MRIYLRNLYKQFRKCGMDAHRALDAARTYKQFQRLETEGLVRLRAEPEDDNYFDVYGEPDGYTDIHGRRVSAEQAKQDIIDSIERDGCWYCVSEWFDGQEWQHADSIGMCSGYNNALSPFDNWYIPDLMQGAIDAVENNAVAAAI